MQLPSKDQLPGDIFYYSGGLFYISGTYEDEDAFEDRTDILVWRYDSKQKITIFYTFN